ncbi:39S ribosomal protein L22, mitochondrial [Coniothyrium glycines]
MSARLPARRLGQPVLAFRPRPARSIPARTFAATACRNASSDSKDEDLRNPILEDYLKRRAQEKSTDANNSAAETPALREGSMSKSPSSLFLPEREMPGWRPDLPPHELARVKEQAHLQRKAAEREQARRLSSKILDPDPSARRQIERKLIIAGVKRHGRMTKAQQIARTERQSLYKSKLLPTSVKKLQKVVNQIAGKTVSEALVQLRFSKKKVARDVIKGLEIAQNEAIVARGMGLGRGESAVKRWHNQRDAKDMAQPRDHFNYKTTEQPGTAVNKKDQTRHSTIIELKDGTKKKVRDPSEIYIDQVWVGPGESWRTPEYRARGAINMLKHRTTSFSFLLKEERTRMRISEEIKKKRDNRKVWVALPDRPVTSQRQYCLW